MKASEMDGFDEPPKPLDTAPAEDAGVSLGLPRGPRDWIVSGRPLQSGANFGANFILRHRRPLAILGEHMSAPQHRRQLGAGRPAGVEMSSHGNGRPARYQDDVGPPVSIF